MQNQTLVIADHFMHLITSEGGFGSHFIATLTRSQQEIRILTRKILRMRMLSDRERHDCIYIMGQITQRILLHMWLMSNLYMMPSSGLATVAIEGTTLASGFRMCSLHFSS